MSISPVSYTPKVIQNPSEQITSIRTALKIINNPDTRLSTLCFAERKIAEFKKTSNIFLRFCFFLILHIDKKAHTIVEDRWETDLKKYCTKKKEVHLEKVFESTDGKKFFNDMLVYFGIDTLLNLSFEEIQYLSSQIETRLSKEQQKKFFKELSKGNISIILDIIGQFAPHDPIFSSIIDRSSPSIKRFFEITEDQTLTLEQIHQEISKLTIEKRKQEQLLKTLRQSSIPSKPSTPFTLIDPECSIKISLYQSRLSHLRQLEAHKISLLQQKISSKHLPQRKYTIEDLENSPFNNYHVEFFQNTTGSYVTFKKESTLLGLATITIQHPTNPSKFFTYAIEIPIKKGTEKDPVPLKKIKLPKTGTTIALKQNGLYSLIPIHEEKKDLSISSFVKGSRSAEAEQALFDIHAYVKNPQQIVPIESIQSEKLSHGLSFSICSPDNFKIYSFTVDTKSTPIRFHGTSSEADAFGKKICTIYKTHGISTKITSEKLPELHDIPHIVVIVNGKKKAILFNKEILYTYSVDKNGIEPDPHSAHDARFYLAKMVFKTGNTDVLSKLLAPIASYRIEETPERKLFLEEIFFTMNIDDVTKIAAQIRAGTLLKGWDQKNQKILNQLKELIKDFNSQIAEHSTIKLTLEELEKPPSIPLTKIKKQDISTVPQKTSDCTAAISSMIEVFSLQPGLSLDSLKEVLAICSQDNPDTEQLRKSIRKSRAQITTLINHLSTEQKKRLKEKSTTIHDLQKKETPLTEDENTLLSIERTKHVLGNILERLEIVKQSPKAIRQLETAIANLQISPFDPKKDLEIRTNVEKLSAAILPEILRTKSTYFALVHTLHAIQHIEETIKKFASDESMCLFLKKSKEEQEDTLDNLFEVIDITISDEDLKNQLESILREYVNAPAEQKEKYKLILQSFPIDKDKTYLKEVLEELKPLQTKIIEDGTAAIEKISANLPPISIKDLKKQYETHNPLYKEQSPFYVWLRDKGVSDIETTIEQTTRLLHIEEEINYAKNIERDVDAAVAFIDKNPLESVHQYTEFIAAYDYSLRHPSTPLTNTAGFVDKEKIQTLEKFVQNIRSGIPITGLKKIISDDLAELGRCKQCAEKEAAIRRTTLFSHLNKGLPLTEQTPKIDFLMIMYARHRPQEADNSPFIQYIQKYNPNIDPKTIIPLMQQYLCAYQEFQQIERTEKALQNISIDSDIPSDIADKLSDVLKQWNAARQYENIDENPHIQVFEVFINSYLYESQIQTINNYGDIDSNVLSQLLMGTGKTFALLPLIALFRADGKNLSSIMVPNSLLPTVVSDMIQRLGSDFASLLYQCPEISTQDSKETFEKILRQMKETIAQRGCMIISPDRRHTFFNALSYFLEKSKIEEAMCVAQILSLIDESEVMVVDEIDDVLKLNLTYIISMGDPKPIPLTESCVLADMFSHALDILKDAHVAVVDKEKQQPTLLSKKEYKEKYLPLLAQKAVELLSHAWPKELHDFDKEKLKLYFETEYIDEKNKTAIDAVTKEFEKHSLSKECLEHLAGMRSWLQSIFLDCLNATENKDYGITDLQETAWAIPFSGPNTPASTTFSNPYQLLTYTLQSYAIKRIPAGYLKKLLEQNPPKLQPFIEKLFPKKSAAPTADELAHALEELRKNDYPLWNNFVKEFLLPNAVYHEHTIVSDSYKLATGSHSTSGFSGTTYNVKTMSRFTQTFSDIATEADTLAVLHAKAEKGAAVGGICLLQPSDDSLLTLIQKQDPPISTLIDSGGWLSSYKDGAKSLALDLLRTKSYTEIVFNTKEGILIKATLDDKGELKPEVFDSQKESAKEGRFTIYGMNYTTGIDIKQLDTATCLLTTSASMILRDDLQGIFRMRKIKTGDQGAFIALNKETAKSVNETIFRDITTPITYDELMRYFITNQNRKVEKDIQQSAIGRMKNHLERRVRKDLIKILTDSTRSQDTISKEAIALFEQCRPILITKKESAWDQYGSIPRLITREERREKDIEQQMKTVRELKKPDGAPLYKEEDCKAFRRQFEEDYPLEDLPKMLPEYDAAKVGLQLIQEQILSQATKTLLQGGAKTAQTTQAAQPLPAAQPAAQIHATQTIAKAPVAILADQSQAAQAAQQTTEPSAAAQPLATKSEQTGPAALPTAQSQTTQKTEQAPAALPAAQPLTAQATEQAPAAPPATQPLAAQAAQPLSAAQPAAQSQTAQATEQAPAIPSDARPLAAQAAQPLSAAQPAAQSQTAQATPAALPAAQPQTAQATPAALPAAQPQAAQVKQPVPAALSADQSQAAQATPQAPTVQAEPSKSIPISQQIQGPLSTPQPQPATAPQPDSAAPTPQPQPATAPQPDSAAPTTQPQPATAPKTAPQAPSDAAAKKSMPDSVQPTKKPFTTSPDEIKDILKNPSEEKIAQIAQKKYPHLTIQEAILQCAMDIFYETFDKEIVYAAKIAEIKRLRTQQSALLAFIVTMLDKCYPQSKKDADALEQKRYRYRIFMTRFTKESGIQNLFTTEFLTRQEVRKIMTTLHKEMQFSSHEWWFLR